jgi:hypothetical protein
MRRFYSDEHIEVLTQFIKEIIAMSALTDAMTAALANLETKLTAGGLTAADVTAQIHTVVDPQVATLSTALATFQASQTKDEAAIADLTAAVTQFTAAFAPAASPAPAAPAAPAAGA